MARARLTSASGHSFRRPLGPPPADSETWRSRSSFIRTPNILRRPPPPFSAAHFSSLAPLACTPCLVRNHRETDDVARSLAPCCALPDIGATSDPAGRHGTARTHALLPAHADTHPQLLRLRAARLSSPPAAPTSSQHILCAVRLRATCRWPVRRGASGRERGHARICGDVAMSRDLSFVLLISLHYHDQLEILASRRAPGAESRANRQGPWKLGRCGMLLAPAAPSISGRDDHIDTVAASSSRAARRQLRARHE